MIKLIPDISLGCRLLGGLDVATEIPCARVSEWPGHLRE